MKLNYDFSKARRGAVIPASENKDKTTPDKNMRKRLSILTANVKKSAQKAKISLDKGLKDVEDALGSRQRTAGS